MTHRRAPADYMEQEQQMLSWVLSPSSQSPEQESCTVISCTASHMRARWTHTGCLVTNEAELATLGWRPLPACITRLAGCLLAGAHHASATASLV